MAGALSGDGFSIPSVFIGIATRGDHVALVDEGLAGTDEHCGEHAYLVVEEVVEIGKHGVLLRTVGTLYESDRGCAFAILTDDLLRFDNLASAASAGRVVEANDEVTCGRGVNSSLNDGPWREQIGERWRRSHEQGGRRLRMRRN